MAKNKTKDLLTGGLYAGGDVGTIAADQAPLDYFNHALANEGRTAQNTSAFGWDFLQNQGFNNVYNGWKEGLAKDKNLTFLNHMATTYGTTPGMSAANPYVGSSALAPVVVNQEWGDPDGLGGHRRHQRRRR